MKDNFINKLPIRIVYSLESLIKELEDSEYNYGEFKAFLDYLKEVKPELIDGVEDFGNFENSLKDVELIIDKIIPKPLMKYNLKAITVPFSDKFIFTTNRLKDLLENNKTNLKFDYKNIDYTTRYKFCCYFILSKYYKVNLDFNLSNQLEIENNHGYKTFLGADINSDYFRIFPSDKKFELTENEIDELLNNYENTALWFEKMPIGSWIAKGFNIVSFFDNTTEIALSNLKSKLITYGEPFDEVKNDIISSLRSVFRNGDLNVGLSAYFENKSILENKTLFDSILDQRKFLKLKNSICFNNINKDTSSEPNFYVISDLDKFLEQYPNDEILTFFKDNGIKSTILCPLKKGDNFLGILELTSKETQVFNRVNANILKEIIPLFEESLNRYNIEFENQINAYIQTEYTSLHPSVNWKFREKAIKHLTDFSQSKQKPQVSFQNLYPMYGEIDVRNSSIIRNQAVKIDYQNQINYLIKICKELHIRSNDDKFLENINVLNHFLSEIDNVDKIYFESEIFDYITKNIHTEIPKHVLPEEKSIIIKYLKKLDKITGLFYKERKKFDKSIQTINTLLSNKLDFYQSNAQKIFPHYYERFKTDGIDYNLYVGKSISPLLKFNYKKIKKIRFWQLETMINLEQLYKTIQHNIPLKMDVCSLIFTTNTTLDITFKLDEKRFDVNGYNNAKYEIIKKRISKATVKGTHERISQPGKICIVYTDDSLKDEYIEYIQKLISEERLNNDIEYLEIDDLQGISGLLALRVSVNYTLK